MNSRYDLIRIVGYENYYESLSLNYNYFLFLSYEIKPQCVLLFFQYESKSIQVTVNNNDKLTNFECDICHRNNCPHLVLAIDYVLNNTSTIDQYLLEANNFYDEDYNKKLFKLLEKNSKVKIKLNTEVILKYKSDFTYELQLKLGETRKYSLKKNMEEFLENFRKTEKSVTIVFGKDFVYKNDKYFFSDEDEEIIEFIESVYTSQQYDSRYYSHFSGILLHGQILKTFLKLIENKPFKIEYENQKINCEKIRKYKLDVQLNHKEDQIELNIINKMIPFTKDYEYILENGIFYHLNSDVKSILEIMANTKHQKLIFKEKEFEKFSNLILPKVKEENFQMSKELEDKFIVTTFVPNFYFEKKNNGIESEIKLVGQGMELNIFDKNLKTNHQYISRDLSKEKEYVEELTNLGFQLNKNKFKLEKEEDIVSFLSDGIKKLTEKFPTFVSENIKKIKVFQKTKVTSTFSIGQDNILKYDFSIENIETKEISKLLEAIKYKKKFYKLKSGDFMALDDNKNLEEFSHFVDQLGIRSKDLNNETFVLPKYKSLHINELKNDYNFIEVNKNFEDLIDNFNKYKNLKINLTKSDLDILRDYQEIGVKWMSTIHHCGFGGILADEMGLGKSIQSIKYIELQLKNNEKHPQFLIVSPTSLIYNWEEEFKKFGKKVKIMVINDSKEKRVEKLSHSQDFDVLITTYGLLRQDIDVYKEKSFHTFLIDEAQNIKNVNSGIANVVKQINADTKFALTGTPLENSLLELWSIFDFIMPGYLPDLSEFKSIYNAKTLETNDFKDLNKQISPFILRRRKKDVLKELPDKFENIVYVDMCEEQKKYYVAQLEITKKEIEKTMERDGFLKSQILILSLLTKLRQLCIDPHLLIENYEGSSSKFETILDILENAIENEHKILLFSQYPSALKLLIPLLQKKGITFCYLDGSTKSKDRMNLVDQFNHDDTNVFLISLKAGGTGLNLTSADIVIHLDPWWNPAVENQATDRAHRIGQNKKVEVIKLICKGTIEEKIIDLQLKKKNLSDQVIEGEDRANIVLSKLSETELRKLLEY